MTREEAIARIKNHKIAHKMNEPRAIYISEALDMAIKVLEQEPCEDAISREAVHDLIATWLSDYLTDEIRETLETIDGKVEDLPPVTPTQKWIPVSERLPEELEPVNITWINHNPESYYADIKDKPFTATGVYFNGQWYWWSTLCTDILAEYSHNYDDVIDDDIEIIAWQPLPESYEPQESEG